VAAVAVAAWPGGGAGAVEPDAVGYWVEAQRDELPGPLTQPLPAADPVVPAGGMYVANSADGPKAISAVVYSVEGAVSATLELKVHSYTPPPPSGLPQEPPSPNPSLITIGACPADPWAVPEGGKPGAWADRPRHTDDCVLGQFSGDGSMVTFELRADQQASEGVFNMAIVPVPVSVDPSAPPVNRPFSVTFDPPREESLAPGEADTGFPPDDGEEPPFDIIDVPAYTGGDFGSVPSEPVAGPVFTVPTTPAPTVPPAPRVNLPRSVARPAVAVPDDDRGQRILAVSLLMALAVAWWWFGGQQSRGPQLLGSLAADGRRPPRSAEPTGGIGRFARPRTTSPRKLL